jgi:beta-galactosidase
MLLAITVNRITSQFFNLYMHAFLFNLINKKSLAVYSLYIIGLILSCHTCCGQGTSHTSKSGRTVISFNDKWLFVKDSASHSYQTLTPLSSWQAVTLPHTWNATDVMDDEHVYYRGAAWYKKQFTVGPATARRQFFLYFNGANQQTEVYINGRKAGSHAGGYTRFCIPINHLLKPDSGAVNEIAVKVDNSYDKNVPPLTADFTFYGGIYRNVYLIETAPVHFNMMNYASNGIQIRTPIVDEKEAKLAITSQLSNSSSTTQHVRVVNTIYDAEGNIVAHHQTSVKLSANVNSSLSQRLQLEGKPHLWSPDDPYLYRVVTQLIDIHTQEVIDEVVNPLGLRWFSFDAAKGFILNGQSLKLIGASRHQDYKGLGNALPDALQTQDVKLLKDMGGNFLRIAHYPQDPTILEACDRLGIIASVEIPVVNEITESESFSHNCQEMLREMIRQNYNHPSIVIWAYMNEVLLRPKYAKDKPMQDSYFKSVTSLAKQLDSVCRSEDPARYTMISNHGDFDLYHKTGLTGVPMLVGWNLYQGWYSGDLTGFGRFLDHYHEIYPGKPMLVTEYGADGDERIHTLNPLRFDKSVEYTVKYHAVYLNEIQSRPFVAGAAAWNLADFNSESREETMPHINNKGLLTWDRKPKDPYFLYQAALLKTPFIKIGSVLWKVRTGEALTVMDTAVKQPITVYTNLNNIVLKVNGLSLGQGNKEGNTYTWQVPFHDGINRLEAIAETNGKTHQDQVEINFILKQHVLRDSKKPFQDMNILLGANRYYVDELTHQIWQPDQPYQKGSWGSIGGKPYKEKNGRQNAGSDKAIAGTDNDPVFQTQQVGIERYALDVPDGFYELTLNFAELAGGKAKEALPYNLDGASTARGIQYAERIFDVYANGQLVIQNLNIARDYGYAKAVSKKIFINVTSGKGIRLQFSASRGEAVLNSLQVSKVQ